MSGFCSPNHTQVPNDLFDAMMKNMGECELKVTLVIIRKTLGYHKSQDPISISQIMDMSGLSKQGVLNGVEAAVNRGTVQIVGIGRRNVTVYELVLSDSVQPVNDIDMSKDLTSTSQQNRPVTSQRSRHTKEKGTKENRQKKGSTRTPSKKWEREDLLIDIWAKVRGIDADNIGADIHTTADRNAAKKLLKWDKPPTEDEITAAINRSTSKAYAFTWLEKDVIEIRNAQASHPQVVPAEPMQKLPTAEELGVENPDEPITPEQVEEMKAKLAQIAEGWAA